MFPLLYSMWWIRRSRTLIHPTIIHFKLIYATASAPEIISEISRVIDACRALL